MGTARKKEPKASNGNPHDEVFSLLPFPCFICAHDTHAILAVNKAAIDLYGYTNKQFLDLTFHDLCVDGEIEHIAQKISTSDRHEEQGTELRQRKKSGDVILVETHERDFTYEGHAALIVVAHEITLRRRGLLAIEASERKFRDLFQRSLGLIFMHDLNGVLLSVNPAVAEALEYTLSDMLGRNLAEFVPPSHKIEFAAYLKNIQSSRKGDGTIELQTRSGALKSWHFSSQAVIYDDVVQESYVLGYALDVTRRLKHDTDLRELNSRDPLTGCYNKLYLERFATYENQVWGCIVIDLDRFTSINDVHGHRRGDELLVATAHFLARHGCSSDAVIRTGGDKFALVLCSDGFAVEQVASRIMAAGPLEINLSFSMGWTIRQDDESLEQTLERANQQLYLSRKTARENDQQIAKQARSHK